MDINTSTISAAVMVAPTLSTAAACASTSAAPAACASAAAYAAQEKNLVLSLASPRSLRAAFSPRPAAALGTCCGFLSTGFAVAFC